MKGNANPREHVEDLFDRARMAGAMDGPAEVAAGGPQRPAGAFTGIARTLAGGDLAPPPAAAAEGAPSQDQPQRIVHNIAFYANGVFTVDDGAPPLNSYGSDHFAIR